MTDATPTLSDKQLADNVLYAANTLAVAMSAATSREVRAPNGRLIGHILARCGGGEALVVRAQPELLTLFPYSPTPSSFATLRLKQAKFNEGGVEKWVFAPSGEQIPGVAALPWFSPFQGVAARTQTASVRLE